MKLNLQQTKLVGLTMQIDLLVRELNDLKQDFENKQQTASYDELLTFKQQFQAKHMALKKLHEELKLLTV